MGPAGENGMPILNNACTVWTPYGARYTFFDPVNIHVEDERCENGAYYVDVSLSGGLGALSSNMAYRSVFDGIKTYENLNVGEVVTFGPYEGTGEYHITAKGAKGCQAEYLGTYNCDVTHRNASINWGGSNIFEIKYTNPDLVIEAVQIFSINGQSVQANIQMDNNSCEIELQNQINGSLFFVQLLVRDRRTEKSFSVSEKLYKN